VLVKGILYIEGVGVTAQNPDRSVRSFPVRPVVSFKVVPFHLLTGHVIKQAFTY